jgi:hypothetical protein
MDPTSFHAGPGILWSTSARVVLPRLGVVLGVPGMVTRSQATSDSQTTTTVINLNPYSMQLSYFVSYPTTYIISIWTTILLSSRNSTHPRVPTSSPTFVSSYSSPSVQMSHRRSFTRGGGAYMLTLPSRLRGLEGIVRDTSKYVFFRYRDRD